MGSMICHFAWTDIRGLITFLVTYYFIFLPSEREIELGTSYNVEIVTSITRLGANWSPNKLCSSHVT